jgi:hypothetical protein
MRDLDLIDKELAVLVNVRRSIQEMGGRWRRG